jgi:hypothetical protein
MASKQTGGNAGGSHQSGGSERGGSGNFDHDPKKANEDGKKAGSQHSQHSRKDSQVDSDKGQRSGSGNFANDPDKASEAGRKGGQHSHSGGSTK